MAVPFRTTVIYFIATVAVLIFFSVKYWSQPDPTPTTDATTTTTAKPPDTKTYALFKNADFEDKISDDWSCTGCNLTLRDDSYAGNGSALVSYVPSDDMNTTSSNDTEGIRGLGQNTNVKPNTRYIIQAYVKLLNLSPGKVINRIEVIGKYNRNSSLPKPPTPICQDTIQVCNLIPNGCDDITTARTICRKFCDQCDPDVVWIGSNPMMQPAIGWQEIGGDITTPTDVTSMTLIFRIFGKEANFLVDDVSLTELPTLVDWKTAARARIEMLRKANLTMTVKGDVIEESKVQIEVIQKKHSFPFGMAVNVNGINDAKYKMYQDFVYNNFNWAVLENALKWGKTEKTKGNIDYTPATKALDELKRRGIKVRGHTVFWGVPLWGVQPWVAQLSKADLILAMKKRYEVVNITKSKLQHWDVNNENLHGQFYETKLGNANATMDMFAKVNSLDPDVKLFLNDFNVVLTSSSMTVAIKNQGKQMKESKSPIHGIGIQSHLSAGQVDITAIKHRIDKVAEAGLPVWITELSYAQPDITKKTEAIEQLMTLYFSHPAIEGICLWGFWDEMIFNKDAALASGSANDLKPNEAGKRLLKLLNEDWKTYDIRYVDKKPIVVRGFLGEYEIRVKKRGKVVQTQTINLDKNGASVVIDLSNVLASNLVVNGDFEAGTTNWICEKCSMAISKDSFHGNQSVLVSGSTSAVLGLGQKITVVPGSRYTLSSFVKLQTKTLNQIFNRIEMVAKLTRNNSLPKPPAVPCDDVLTNCKSITNVCNDITTARSMCRKFCSQCDQDIIWVGTNPMMHVEKKWQEVGGDILVPTDVDSLTVHFRIFGANAAYLVDYVIVKPLPDITNWKEDANKRINKIRKSDITIRVTGGKTNSQVKVEVEETKHAFPFGTAVRSREMGLSSYSKYQNFVYNNFNWAVLENALKWSETERHQGIVDYQTPTTSLDILAGKGMNVRGNSVFSGTRAGDAQTWISTLNATELSDAMDKRYQVVNVAKGKLAHWNVNNENQHGQFYEEKLQDANITATMFNKIRSLDPDVKLFLNDYNVVTQMSSSTTAFKNQGAWLKGLGIPIYGMGIQSHFTEIDIVALKYRLDKIAELGLPIWITQLSFNQPDVQKKAQDLENVMTLLFSHPAVNGIVMWGFWEHAIYEKNAALFLGSNLTPNAAGEKLLKLLNEEWKTKASITIKGNNSDVLRGFFGDYKIKVTQVGCVSQAKTSVFSLDSKGKTISIKLNSGSCTPPGIEIS